MKHLSILKIQLLAIFALLFIATVPSAMAQGGLEVGVLTCKSVPSTRLNYIFHSNTVVDCIFTHSSGEERYMGEMGMGIGVDLQLKSNAQTVFTVIAVSSDTRSEAYSLEGTYVGGKASAALVIGVGVPGCVSQ